MKQAISNPQSRISNFAALVLITALVLLFFWRILTPRLEDRAVFPPGDFTDQFWAFRVYTARAFAQGRLPLWSDNFYSGHPFLADVQSAIFYPISLVWTLIVIALRGANFTLLDLELEAIFHFILTGAFTFLFAQRLIGSRAAALVSALTFTFGGYLTSYPPQQLAILETATWLPLILFFLDRGTAANSQSPISNLQSLNFIAAGIVLGIAALAGHPQTLLFVVYACVIYFVYCVLRTPLEVQGSRFEVSGFKFHVLGFTFHVSRFMPPVLRFAFALVLAAGISAAQWIPAFEYQQVSTRVAITWAEAARGFPTLDPLQMILPGFVSAFQSPLYIGILPLWLAIFALWVNRRREKIFWAFLVLGSFLVAFGFYAFAYALFYLAVPGFALFRGQERLALVISFALAILAGYGFRDLTRAFDVRRAQRAWALLPAGIVIGLMFVFTLYVSGTLRASGRVAFLGDRAALVTLLFTLATVLVAWRLRLARATSPFVVATIALIVFDLFSINSQAYNATPRERYPNTPIVQTIREESGVFRVVDEGKMPGHFGIVYDLEEIGGISPLKLARYDFLRENLSEEKLWRWLNVRYVITGRPGLENAELVTNDGDTRLLRLNDTMPRAWFVASAMHNPDDAQVLALLASDDFDAWRVVYLAEPSLHARAPSPHAPTPATFEHITPEHARVTLDAPSDGWLVVSANYYYPGWHAFVNGIETRIVRANIALCAVPVRAGAQRVEFVFEPWSVKVGMTVSTITLILLVLALVIILSKQGLLRIVVLPSQKEKSG